MSFPPPGLTQSHLHDAAAKLDSGASHQFGEPTRYWAILDGRRYAPKALIGLAAGLASGREYGPSDFSGGEGAGQANAVLRSLGIEVVEDSDRLGDRNSHADSQDSSFDITATDQSGDDAVGTYLLVWNPNRWQWQDYAGYARAVADGSAEPMMWSVGNRQRLPAGSRLFLVRLGQEPKGVIGSGVAVDDVHEELHWNAARAERGDKALHTTIRFDHLLDADVSPPLDAGRSGIAALEAFNWLPQSSGVEIPADVAAALETAWLQHVQGQVTSRAAPVPVSLAGLSSVLIRVGERGSVFRSSQNAEPSQGSGLSVGRGGGARRSSAAKQIGDRAESLVKQHLEVTLPPALRSTIRHHAAEGETPGYDLSYGHGDSLVAVEVKGSVQAVLASIELTANEWRAAQELGDRYHLYIVGNANSNRPVIEVITHAASRLLVEPAVYRARVLQA